MPIITPWHKITFRNNAEGNEQHVARFAALRRRFICYASRRRRCRHAYFAADATMLLMLTLDD